MLKAYDYAEKQELAGFNTSPEILSQQREIAEGFLKLHRLSVPHRNCPACGSEDSRPFATIFDIGYQRCASCFSIFALVDARATEEYRSYEAVLELHQSGKFQKSSHSSRIDLWHDMLFWIRFRCARYLGRAKGFAVLDIDDIYDDLTVMLAESSLCSEYHAFKGILKQDVEAGLLTQDGCDIVMFIDQLRKYTEPKSSLLAIHQLLKDDGLLFLSTRLGSGFDVISLKGNLQNLFPCEHLFLPTPDALTALLEETGFEVLEFFTPGNLDIIDVVHNKDLVADDEPFVQQLLMLQDTASLLEFQRFLQRSGLSSYARLVARKRAQHA